MGADLGRGAPEGAARRRAAGGRAGAGVDLRTRVRGQGRRLADDERAPRRQVHRHHPRRRHPRRRHPRRRPHRRRHPNRHLHRRRLVRTLVGLCREEAEAAEEGGGSQEAPGYRHRPRHPRRSDPNNRCGDAALRRREIIRVSRGVEASQHVRGVILSILISARGAARGAERGARRATTDVGGQVEGEHQYEHTCM